MPILLYFLRGVEARGDVQNLVFMSENTELKRYWNRHQSSYDETRLNEEAFMLARIGFGQLKIRNILVTSILLKEAKEVTVAIELPEINKVHLQDLPNLRSFSNGNIIEWPSLENVVVNGCPNLKKFGLGKIKSSQLKLVIMENQVQHVIDTKVTNLFELSDDEFSTITEYNIVANEELGKTLNNLQSSHFTNLVVLRAKNCDEKLNVFLHILMKRSNKLEVLNIEQCKTLRFVFDVYAVTDDEVEDGKYFTEIKELKLIELDELKYIWNRTMSENPARMYGFRNLQMIHIKSCPSLWRSMLKSSVAEELHQLNELKLEACKILEEVVYGSDERIIKFPALSKVEFKSLSSLERFYKYQLEFPSLKTLMIEKCPWFENFAAGFATSNASSITDEKSFSELNELKLDSCHKMVVVVSSKTLQELRNLKKLIVSHCESLEMVFNIHEEISHSTNLLQELDELILIDLPNLTHIIKKEIAKFSENLQILQVKKCKSLNRLPMSLKLKNLEISDCEALEKSMIIDEKEGTRRSANFSQLKDVTLENLKNLSVVFPSTSEFPSLETLKVANCPSLMTFVDEESSKSKDRPEPSTSNYFFPNSLSLDKLKVLYVINQVAEKLWHCSCPNASFCELENMTLSNNNKLLGVISSSMIKRFNNLKKLTLDKCELLTEVFNLEDEKPDLNIQEMLPQLSALALSNLRGLTGVWNKEPQVPFFQNLVSLFIVHCDSLKTLFSLSSAQKLGKLKLLRLYGCDKIEEVLSSDNDENMPIIFPKIESLVLKDLPKLVSFCQQSGVFDWPNLQTLRVSNIPSMETFSRANFNTPLLRSVHITFSKKLWLGNLNDTISYMHNNPVKIK